MNKFAIPYNRFSPYLKEVGEIILKYRPGDTLIDSLTDFLQEHINQRIVLDIADLEEFFALHEEVELNQLLQMKEIDNWVLRVPNIPTEEQVKKLSRFPYFVNSYVDTFEQMQVLLRLGVTDIYVTNELAFDVKELHGYLAGKGVKLRIIPNIAQSADEAAAAITKFFIRPEDIIEYDPYIDVFEIGLENKKVSSYDIVAYKAYAIDKIWFGNLAELILKLDEEVESPYLHPNFAKRRLSCHKKCLTGHPCNICSAYQELSKTLKKAKIMVERKE